MMKRQITRKHLYGLIVGLAALSASAATAEAQETQRQGEQDSTKWGYSTDSTPEVQNPPGYRGMERPSNVFTDSAGQDSAAADSSGRDSAGAVEDRVTGTYDDSTWQDTSAARQNPAGYRGMERPVGDDTTKAGKGEHKQNKAKRRLGKTASDSGTVSDTSAADSVAPSSR
ncbi:MAG: hypothetical protein ACR2HK_08775 [Gemmatimonadales bacterium]